MEPPSPPSTRRFWLRRWHQFWVAPVTAFLGNVVMYLLFLFLFSYVLLLDFDPPPPKGPSGTEIVLYIWVFTLVCEEVRQGCFVGSHPMLQRVRLYFQDTWNQLDITALLLFMIGLVCRLIPQSYESGRTILCLDFMVFTVRLIHIFAVNKQLGPKMIIVGRMMKDVFLFLFFLGVWLVAYGVTTEGMLLPHDRRLPWIFRRVFYRPYLQIFGQIPLDEIDAALIAASNCTYDPVAIVMDNAKPCTNTYANWLVLILLTVLELSEAQDGRLLTWESVQKENYLVTQARQKRDEDTERLRRTSQKYDWGVEAKSRMEYCTSALSWMVDVLAQSDIAKGRQVPPTQKK
ncbi:hypothetical protein JD844_001798, partial [Phrynosoma platyrhinos]